MKNKVKIIFPTYPQTNSNNKINIYKYMKLECLKDRLRQAVLQAERVTGKNLTLPVLSSVLLEAKNSKLTIKATNLEVGLEISIPAKIEEEGSVTINALILGNFLTNNNEEKLKIDLINNNINIATNSTKTTIKSLGTEDFPLIPIVDEQEGEKARIEVKELISGLKSVVFAAATSDIKPEISSVYIYSQDGAIFFVATDSFRLAEKKIIAKSSNDFPRLIIPLKNVLEIIRVLEGVEDKEVDILADKHQLSLITASVRLTSRVIDGIYPDYRQIMPVDFKTEATLRKDELLNSLKISSIFSDRFNQIEFTIKPKEEELMINSQNQDIGENTIVIKGKITGNEIGLNLNAKYLLDCLPIIENNIVELKINEKNRPLLVRGSENDFQYIVMPINR
ncbi:MAG: DNA polymerase III subunit beta [Candidatus Paceibacterota bacterium]